jgi:hypothetical protein
MLRRWRSQVSETVSKRAVASSPLCATIAGADFAPLHDGAQRPFRTVVGGLDAWMFEETE